MKFVNSLLKVMLLMFLYLWSIQSIQAQRKVDISCEAILKPDTIFTYQPTFCSIVVKNNGPDTLYESDSLLIRFKMPGNGFNDLYMPSMGTYIKVLNKILNPSDTILVEQLMQAIIVHKTDFNEFTALLDLYVRLDTSFLVEERFSNRYNNDKLTSIWYIGNNIGMGSISNDHLSIYPNVTSSLLTIESPQLIQSICLIDLNGKRIDIKFDSQRLVQEVDVSFLSAGIYTVQIQTAEGVYHTKIIKL